MDFIIILLLVVILILVGDLKNKIRKISSELSDLKTQKSTKEINVSSSSESSKQTEIEHQKTEQKPIPEIVSPALEPKAVEIQEAKSTPQKAVPKKRKPAVSNPSLGFNFSWSKFLAKNPDLEKFIGENLLSKIGIVIFVIGMGFLVKLGIDSNVITEGMRVAIGVAIGGGMITLAHYMRKSFAKFSSVLIGGALAVLYFSIALAFHQYHLINQTAAFLIMVFITSFGVLLSLAYNRSTLAVLAIIGGFGTPFFVSNGSGNISAFFAYILILDIGMLILVYFKKWNIINYIAFCFTFILFIGVFYSKFLGNEEELRITMFANLTCYYIIFFLMSIVYNVRNKKTFKFPEISMLFANTAFYFGFGIQILNGLQHGMYNGLFTLLLAILNFGFAYRLYSRKDVDRNLVFMLIGLVLSFVSLIAPIQLEGNYITLFWAVESCLLLWLSEKSGIKLIRVSSIIISILMAISLLMDWNIYYIDISDYNELAPVINKGFLTTLVCLASLIIGVSISNKDFETELKGYPLTWKSIINRIAAVVIFYFGFLLEFDYQFKAFGFSETLASILLGVYNYAFITAIILVHKKSDKLVSRNSAGIAAIVGILLYPTYYLERTIASRDFNLLNQDIATGFYWHYVLLASVIYLVVFITQEVHKAYKLSSKNGAKYLYILSFLAVLIGTAEITHLAMITQQNSGNEEYLVFDTIMRSVFPVVWGIIATALIIVGMKYKLKALRIASLVLFGITTLKLFFFDLNGNSTGKIISFIFLGAILLTVSFLYQKLKFLITDDEDNN
ncbi:DUF2339 domain-containing protein [Reichenbachiella versicolor]|uniref:DUF2339 domain-containing protein n=1 Tax=Reichenbachiella versicolor TaxID=1821036 RepID=UPI000D6E4C4D|nr:DUF2339 domain-containing protein [Reichenbachiella versicolor]